MKLLKLIFKYLTNSVFRNSVNRMIALLENKNGAFDNIEKTFDEDKQYVLNMLKKRIETLSTGVDHMKAINKTLASPLNDLLNELKEDYRRIESM